MAVQLFGRVGNSKCLIVESYADLRISSACRSLGCCVLLWVGGRSVGRLFMWEMLPIAFVLLPLRYILFFSFLFQIFLLQYVTIAFLYCLHSLVKVVTRDKQKKQKKYAKIAITFFLSCQHQQKKFLNFAAFSCTRNL